VVTSDLAANSAGLHVLAWSTPSLAGCSSARYDAWSYDLETLGLLLGGRCLLDKPSTQDVMAYLAEENGLLRERLGHNRIIRNVAQKRSLGAAGNKADCDLLQHHGILSW
jgi:hypothetical protein